MYDTIAGPHGGNFCTTSGALTNASASETVYDTTVTITFAVNGKAYTKTAVTDGATPTTDINTGVAFSALTANKGSVFVWALNAAGTVVVAQGSVESLDASGNFINPPQFPMLSDLYTPFAYTIIKAGATASAWTFGASNWNATGISKSVVNVLMLPSRPQIS